MTHEDYLQAYISGDEAAFALLVEACLPMAYRFAYQRLGDHQQAQDVCQIVFSTLAGLGDRGKAIRSVSAWVFSTTRRQIALMMRRESRRRKREHTAVEMGNAHGSTSEGNSEASHDLFPVLCTSIGELSKRDQEALFLRYFEGRSLEQVATALGIRKETAQKRVRRALERLQGLLGARGVTSTASLLAAPHFSAQGAGLPAELGQEITRQALRKPIPAAGFIGALVSSPMISIGILAAGGLIVAASFYSNHHVSANAQGTPHTQRSSILSNRQSITSTHSLAIDDIEGIYLLPDHERERALDRLTAYLKGRTDDQYLSDLFSRWSGLDPQRNARAVIELIRLQSTGDDRQALFGSLLDVPIHEWWRRDAKAAESWIRNLPRTDAAERLAHDSLLRQLVVNDLDTAYLWLTNRGLVRRETVEILSEALLKLPPFELLSLLGDWEIDQGREWVSERGHDISFRHQRGETMETLLSLTIPTLYQQVPDQIVTWLENLESDKLSSRLTSEILEQWASEHPAEAVSWTERLPSVTKQQAESILYGWAKSAPRDALNWALKSLSECQDAYEPALVSWLESEPPEEPQKWLTQHANVLYEPSLFERVAAALPPQKANSWSETLVNPEQCSAVRRQALYQFGRMDRNRGLLLLEAQSPLDAQAAEAFAWGVFVVEGRSGLAELKQNLEIQSELYQSINLAEIDLIAAFKPSSAYAIVRSLPPGANRDEAVLRLIERTRYRSLKGADRANLWARELLSRSELSNYRQSIGAARESLLTKLDSFVVPKLLAGPFHDQSLIELETRLNVLSQIPLADDE